MPNSPSRLWDKIRINLCRNWTFWQSFCEVMCALVPLCLEITLSWKSSSCSNSYNLSPPFPHSPLILGKKRIQFRNQGLGCSHSLHIVLLWVSARVPIYYKRNLLRWWLSEALVYRCSRISLRSHFIADLLQQYLVLPRSMDHLVSGS